MSSITTTRPIIFGVGGFTSEVGKTTLLCDLLRAFPGWEAIKTTRGHYRSCGKDPHACCVSDLLDETVVVRSEREQTYSRGKDTGRYWDAGASDVHWVIATDEQVADGIITAVGRVKAKGVFVEGNSFSEFVTPACFIMVARGDDLKIKASARKALPRVSAFYLSDETEGGVDRLRAFLGTLNQELSTSTVQIFTPSQLPELVAYLSAANALAAA